MAVTNPSALVPADVLLTGSLFALQQCGRLLTDADLLFRERRFPTAAGLALLAHEELGRCTILQGLWKKSVMGTAVSRSEVETACEEHVTKQRAGQFALTFRADTDSQYAQLLRARGKAVGTSEFKNLDDQVKAIDRNRARRQPTDRHDMRMKCFYVDLSENAMAWSKPSDVGNAESAKAPRDAINDYAVERDRILNPAVAGDDVFVQAQLAALSDKPVLDEPLFNSPAFTVE